MNTGRASLTGVTRRSQDPIAYPIDAVREPRRKEENPDAIGVSEWRDPDSNRGHHDFQDSARTFQDSARTCLTSRNPCSGAGSRALGRRKRIRGRRARRARAATANCDLLPDDRVLGLPGVPNRLDRATPSRGAMPNGRCETQPFRCIRCVDPEARRGRSVLGR
jgi:hypothetical protein